MIPDNFFSSFKKEKYYFNFGGFFSRDLSLNLTAAFSIGLKRPFLATFAFSSHSFNYFIYLVDSSSALDIYTLTKPFSSKVSEIFSSPKNTDTKVKVWSFFTSSSTAV